VISVSLIGHRLLIMVFHYAACHSGWHVWGLHDGHMQPNTEQYWYLHNRPHFHGCNSETSSGRTMKLHVKVWESLIEWMQFSSQHYIDLFLRKKWKHYFSVCLHSSLEVGTERIGTDSATH
jgi:hypothetical protein